MCYFNNDLSPPKCSCVANLRASVRVLRISHMLRNVSPPFGIKGNSHLELELKRLKGCSYEEMGIKRKPQAYAAKGKIN